MLTRRATLWFALVLLGTGCTTRGTLKADTNPNCKTAPAPSYPAATRGDVVDVHHGVSVADPYRWLEDPDAAPSRAWIAGNNTITQGWLGEVGARPRVRKRLETLWNYERFGVPSCKGDGCFFTRNDGLQNQDVLMVAKRGEGTVDWENPRPLIDPNTLSKDGTTSVKGHYISADGRYVAYGVSAGGSDWVELRVRDVATGEDTSDVLKWVKFSGASWNAAGTGFYYSRYAAPADTGKKLQSANYFHKLYFHKLGTAQSADVLVYERKDHKEWGFGGHATEDGKFLVVSVWKGTHPENNLFYADLEAKDPSGITELMAGFTSSYSFVGNVGRTFFILTDLGAPKKRLVAVDLAKPEPEHWKTLIAEQAEPIEEVRMVGGRFVVLHLKDARSLVRIHALDGTHERDLALPSLGTGWGFSGKSTDTETYFAFSSFTYPTTIFRHDFASQKTTTFKKPNIAMKASNYVVKQVFYDSKDGTKIPMFIAHKAGLKLDGTAPTYLYGYGGFNISLTPFYSTANRVWMELGGVFAMPNIRGGGEYGEAWHKAGIKTRKQNVFDDFIAAAEWLIANKYTAPKRLAIGGGSNGGLLVGASMTQRPELFGAAVPQVGVLDMLRFHKFTIGWAWASDYGTVEKAEEFKALLAYSPYHNVKPGKCYPPTMIMTGDHDDRVVPAHSFKFGAALQHAQKGGAPILVRIETKAGHGAGKPTSMIIDGVADRIAFKLRALGVSVSESFGK